MKSGSRYLSKVLLLESSWNLWHLVQVLTYQTQKTAFDHISKHQEESWSYDLQGNKL